MAPKDSPPTADSSRTLREDALCVMIAGLLERPVFGVDEDFFQAGGHSLLAVRLASLAREMFGCGLSARDVFQAPTPRGLAQRLDRAEGQSLTAPVLALRPEGDESPLFCVHPILGLGWSYAALLVDLDPDIPLYAVQATAWTGADRPDSLQELAVAYVAAVRELQPAGPYRLAGWSLGGVIAHAMACELQRAGEDVSTLVLIDAYPLTTDAGEAESPDHATLKALLAHVPNTASPPSGPSGPEVGHVTAALAHYLGSGHTSDLVATALANASLARAHTPGLLKGDALFLAAADSGERDPRTWAAHLTGELDVYDLPTGHFDALAPEGATDIAAVLNDHLLDE
ncbi:thioesterase domain-containing protein [Streptomyces sp. bgisy091]|uniref:thioesterase domain-containing protein n=1 Tax=Streptomyces sp. bgisy091 TaxID=3413778 RepID=UPI003D73D0BA